MDQRWHRSRARKRRARRVIIGAGLGLLLIVSVTTIEGLSSRRGGRALQAEAPVQPVASATVSAVVSANSPSARPGTPSASVETKTTPERMARLLPGSRQVIVITGQQIGSRSGKLKVYDNNDGRWVEVMSVPANFGANGLVNGASRTAGHVQTPTGIWRIGGFLFGQHSIPPAGTTMPYRRIGQDSWWSCEANSTYNTWVTSQSTVSGEHLADDPVQYEYAFNTGFNSLPNQRVIGRGTAIFIHCSEPPGNSLGKYTHGCVAIDPSAMRRLFVTLDPARNPTCAIGTLQKGSATSIWAY